MSCNLVDLMELSPAQRQVVRLILRETMMTYDDLCLSLRELRLVAPQDVDPLLADLAAHEWIVSLLHDQVRVYRVNLVRRGAKQNQAFWTRLGVDNASAPDDTNQRTMMRGGKRTLPPAIWDTIERDVPLTREALLASIRGRSRASKEPTSEFGRALRKRVLNALDAISRDEPPVA